MDEANLAEQAYLRVLEAIVRKLEPKPTAEEVDAALACVMQALPDRVLEWRRRAAASVAGDRLVH